MTKGIEIFFVVSLLIFLIVHVTNAIIRAILDSRNGYPVEYGTVWGYIDFLPYDKDVSEGDEKLKRVCNLLQKASIFFLVIFIIAFLLKFVYKL